MKFKFLSKRNFALIFMSMLLIAITICPVSASQNDNNTVKSAKADSNKYSYMEISSDYQEIATEGDITLSADLSSGLFAIRNNKNGFVWYSTPTNEEIDSFSKGSTKNTSQSQLIVGYVHSVDELASARVDYLYSNLASNIEVNEIEHGVRIVYNFEIDLSANSTDDEIENAENSIVNASFPLEITIEDGNLEATVNVTDVKYTDDIIVVDYSVLPYFGAGSWTDNGYMFVPDGSGAIINFSGAEGDASKYSQMVYGEEPALEIKELKSTFTETIRMPVFGMVHNDDNAFLAIIEDGAPAANIEAFPASAHKGHNTINARFNYKLTSTMIMFAKSANTKNVYRISKNSDDIKKFSVKYCFLNGDDANYIGMANLYRDYLLKNNKLTKKDTNPSLNVDLYGAIDVKANFLGFTYSKLQSLTTYEQAVKIAKTLKEKGIDNLDIRYFGWGNSGITNTKPLTSAKTIGILGGKNGFNDMLSYMSKNNINLYPDADLLMFTRGSNKEISKTTFGQTFYEYQYLRSVFSYDLNGFAKKSLLPSKIEEYSSKYYKSYEKLGIENISLSTLTSKVYSHLKPNSLVYRTEFPEFASNSLNNAVKSGLNVVGESANDYTWSSVSKIYKAPVYSSGYNLFNSEVPFYQIVLHGYIPMTGEPMVQSMDLDTTFLKCVESGMELLWSGIYEDSVTVSDTIYDDLYGSTYSLWTNDAAERYTKYQPLLEQIHDQQIINHTEITPQITSTEYENGITVYVNFSDKAYKVDGIKVPARNFAYKEG